MCRGAGGENGSRVGVLGELRDGARDLFYRGWHEKPCFIGEDGVGTAADGSRHARKTPGCSLQVDKSEPFDPTGGIRHAGQAKEVGRTINVANLFVRHRAEKADVAVDRRDEAFQLLHIVTLAPRTDHQPRSSSPYTFSNHAPVSNLN